MTTRFGTMSCAATATSACSWTNPIAMPSSTNTITDNPEAGMIGFGDDNKINRKTVRRNGDGIVVTGDDNSINDNHVVDSLGCPDGCGAGISFEGGSDNHLVRNSIVRALRRNSRECISPHDRNRGAEQCDTRRRRGRDRDRDGRLLSRQRNAAGPQPHGAGGRRRHRRGQLRYDPAPQCRGRQRRPGHRGRGGGDRRGPKLLAVGNGNPLQCTNVACTR